MKINNVDLSNQNPQLKTFFEIFDKKSEEKLKACAKAVRLKSGGILYSQDDRHNNFYILIKGELESLRSQGLKSEIDRIKAGQLVGDFEILTKGNQMTTVKALKDSILLKIPKKEINQLIQDSPSSTKRFIKHIEEKFKNKSLNKVLENIFGSVNPKMLSAVKKMASWKKLKSGETLFEEGDLGNSIYLIITGKLRVYRKNKNDFETTIGEITQGECVGEMGLLTGEKRSASVQAIRDSNLIKISEKNFEQVIKEYPWIFKKIANTIVKRLKNNKISTLNKDKDINIAVVAITSDLPLQKFMRRFERSLSRYGSTLLLKDKKVDKFLNIPNVSRSNQDSFIYYRMTSWLDEQENDYNFIIFEANPKNPTWTKEVLKRADKIILLANATKNPGLSQIEKNYLKKMKAWHACNNLVLVHPNGSPLPLGTKRWLKKRKIKKHIHIKWSRKQDIEKLARIISGNAIGLTLSGGGAKGLAHIGVLRALSEAEIPIDYIGGTSMGAVIAAQYAMGENYKKIEKTHRNVWQKIRPHKEYTIPMLSLLKGKKIDALIKNSYQNIDITDLWINYFCISSDLSRAKMNVHEKGLLRKAVRASISIPGVFTPLLTNRKLFVDGGIFNNFPCDIMKLKSRGYVIGINVTGRENLKVDFKKSPTPWSFLWNRISPFQKNINFPNIVDIISNSMALRSLNKENQLIKQADIYLKPPVKQYGILEFEAIDDIIKLGYEYTKKIIKKGAFDFLMPKKQK
ncbi:MAG: cyclic nucleotide-binding domain-containing protein [Candidatus Moranbacteria bacterium]|nr:cyclic nucleotide-binding domain-containing protein [Candidatus Moranbacteria bacterium]